MWPQSKNKADKKLAYLGGFAAVLLAVGYLGRHRIKQLVTGEANPKNNQQYLDTLHPKYKGLFTLFINRIIAKGYKVQINSAYRDFAKQSELKKEDSRNASAGFSPHNYGLAIDIQVSKNGQTLGKDTATSEWLKSGIPQLAQSMGLDWGGNFKNYADRVHFVVSGIDTSKLFKTALNQFATSNPSKIIGNRVYIA